jgi:hypothetical protein
VITQTELTVPIRTVPVCLLVFLPQQLQGDAFTLELFVDQGIVRLSVAVVCPRVRLCTLSLAGNTADCPAGSTRSGASVVSPGATLRVGGRYLVTMEGPAPDSQHRRLRAVDRVCELWQRAAYEWEPAMKKVRFVGLDVHAQTTAAAVAEPDGEVRNLGTIANRVASASSVGAERRASREPYLVPKGARS